MADASVRTSFVPKTSAADIDALAVLVDAVAGTDTVTVDRGLDRVVSVDMVVADAVLATAEAVTAAVTGAVANAQVFSTISEYDPVLSAPSDIILDISNANVETVIWTATLSPGAQIKSVTFGGTITGVPIDVRGNPQAHESQKLGIGDHRVIARVGPAGGAGGPFTYTLQVTDTNGRVSAVDSVGVTIQA